MSKTHKQIYLILASLLLNSCSTDAQEPRNNRASEEQMSQQNGSKQFSKYSPSESVWVADKDYPTEDFSEPAGDLPKQSIYVVFNPRTHLLDHYIDNTPPPRIELNSWKMDFIAGELALDRMDLPEARIMFEMALKEAEKSKDSAALSQKAFTEVRLGFINRKTGDTSKAIELYKQAIDDLSSNHKKSYTRNEATALDVAYRELALISWKQKNLIEAESYLRKRVAVAKSQCGEIGPTVATTENELANALFYQKKFKDADELYKQCLIVAQRFKSDTDHTLQASWNMANCRFSLHKYADALELYKKLQRSDKEIQACQIELEKLPESQRKITDLPPPSGDEKVCQQLLSSARTCMNSDRAWDAKSLLSAAEAEIKDTKLFALQAKVSLAQAEMSMEQGDYQTALQACQIVIAKPGANSDLKFERSLARGELFICQMATQNYSDAAETLKSLQAEADQKTWAQLIQPINALYAKRQLYNCPESAINLLKTVCDQCIASSADKSMQKARALYNLAHTYQLDRTKPDLATATYEQALAMAAAANDRDEAFIDKMESDLGMAYMARQRYKESELHLSKALAYAEKNPGDENRLLRNALSSMSALYNNWKQADKEEEYYRRGMALNDSIPSFRKGQRLSDLINLSRMSTARGEYKKTEAYLEEAITLGADSSQINSISQDLLRLYQRFGMYEKIASLYLKQAEQVNGKERLRYLYLAAENEFKAGNIQAAEKQIREVIDSLEQSKQTKDRDYGCYYEEPRYSSCLFMLGNCLLDGENNYDKAIVVFDKFEKSFQDAPGGPESRPVANRPVTAQARVPDIEELVNLLICSDAIGNKERSASYRERLKERITAAQQGQLAVGGNTSIARAIELIEKNKRVRADEIALMEAVPKALHKPGQYSGRSDGAELLERAIILRKQSNAVAEVKSDLETACQIYLDNRNFEKGEPTSYHLLEYLKQHAANKQELASAELNYAACLCERGYFSEAKKLLLALLAEMNKLPAEKHLQLYLKLAQCSKYMNENADAIKYTEQALKIAPESTQAHSDALAELQSLKQNVKKP